MEDEKYDCLECQDKGFVEETVCGLCEEGIPHSSCDDTWVRKVPCSCQKKTNDTLQSRT